MALNMEVFINEYIAEWLYWIANHPRVEQFMEYRDSLVERYERLPSLEQMGIRTINYIEGCVISILWMIFRIIRRIVCILVKLWILWMCGFIVYLLCMWHWSTYPPPVTPAEFKGKVILSNDYCFVDGIQTPDIIEWCQSQEPIHSSHIEIINTTGW